MPACGEGGRGREGREKRGVVGGGGDGGFWWVVVGREEGGALVTGAYRGRGARGGGGEAESGRRERANHGQYHSRNVLST